MPGNTDAVAAGQSHVERMKSIMTSPPFLFFMYFWGWGLIKDKIWPPPPPMIGPMLPVIVTPWSIWFLKMFGIGLFMVVLLLLYIYVMQESILYVPAQPIQFIEKNPPRYQKPTERGMQYQEMTLEAKDGIKLQAWFLYHQRSPEKRDTVIFLHENAGNIGLRMDYFEILYNHLDVNIVAVAYRGYSASEGSPSEPGLIMDAEAAV
jgi:hypothetical protein